MECTLSGLLVICSLAAASTVITARGFYCRDPDTGKLYPANTTWPSTTFCGSYTCKLRKKVPSINVASLRQLNISSTEITKTDDAKPVRSNCNSTSVIVEERPTVEDFERLRNSELGTIKNGDRYLTEDEIKAMTFLLQTVKKSDLEAILEVYNLAQDIYKEVDKVPESTLVQEVLREETNKLLEAKKIPNPKDKEFVSYWYEPLTLNSNKNKAEVAVPAVEQKAEPIPVEKPKDLGKVMYFVGPKLKMANANDASPKPLKVNPNSNPTNLQQVIFRGAFSKSDFGKLPYYYPMSKFQRESSYVHENQGGYLQPNVVEDKSPHGTFPNHNGNPQPTYQQVAENSQSMQYRQLESLFNTGAFPQSGEIAQVGNTFPRQDQTQQSLYLVPGDSFPQAGLAVPPNPATYAQPGVPYPAPIYTQPDLCPDSFQANGVPIKNTKPCKIIEAPKKLVPWTRLINKQYSIDSNNRVYESPNKPSTFTEPKVNYPNVNYPLEYLQYNLSSIPSSYFTDSNTWSLLNLYNRHHHHPYLRAAYVAHIPRPIFVNPGNLDETPIEAPVVQKPAEPKIGSLMPEWQTEPLSISVLNEVKANLDDPKLLPYPFRRKVKLEKVGKIYKMDDSNRIKRNVQQVKTAINPQDFEVYIEKSTCKTDTEPGFFRMGNSSEPFPACCPQRISS